MTTQKKESLFKKEGINFIPFLHSFVVLEKIESLILKNKENNLGLELKSKETIIESLKKEIKSNIHNII